MFVPGDSFSCDSVPNLNKLITAYVHGNLRKKIGRGECWDLAAGALNTHQAKWDGRFAYGRQVDYKTECIYPGDIMQFDKVMIETVHATGWFMEEMPHHTAIIYEVHGPGKFTIAHQNYNNQRKVILTDLNMANVKRGKVMIYRPQQ
jgi:hypothetical protein